MTREPRFVLFFFVRPLFLTTRHLKHPPDDLRDRLIHNILLARVALVHAGRVSDRSQFRIILTETARCIQVVMAFFGGGSWGKDGGGKG